MNESDWYDYSSLPGGIGERLDERFRLAAQWTRYAPIGDVLRLSSRDLTRTMETLTVGAAFCTDDVRITCFPGGGVVLVPADLFARTSGFWFGAMIERCRADPSLTEEQTDAMPVFANARGHVDPEDFDRALVEAM